MPTIRDRRVTTPVSPGATATPAVSTPAPPAPAAKWGAGGDVRYGVAEALGEIKSAKAKQALETALAKEKNPTVRFAIEGALERGKRP